VRRTRRHDDQHTGEALERAEGEAVAPAAGLPTVELAENGAPSITVPGGQPPTELVVQPLIEGAGAAVESGQTITVHYTGVLWEGGTQFDSSWERGSPTSFEIGTGAVIPGWDEGLVGQPVGSQILLVVPPAKGYPEGSPDGSISATDTIVFVVDILDAS
jgi:peptidylprolyl isomerase